MMGGEGSRLIPSWLPQPLARLPCYRPPRIVVGAVLAGTGDAIDGLIGRAEGHNARR